MSCYQNNYDELVERIYNLEDQFNNLASITMYNYLLNLGMIFSYLILYYSMNNKFGDITYLIYQTENEYGNRYR